MQAWDNLPKVYFDEWAQNYGYISPSSGETFGELQARFINAVLKQHYSGHVVVYTWWGYPCLGGLCVEYGAERFV
jgi:hypothetical protein